MKFPKYLYMTFNGGGNFLELAYGIPKDFNVDIRKLKNRIVDFENSPYSELKQFGIMAITHTSVHDHEFMSKLDVDIVDSVMAAPELEFFVREGGVIHEGTDISRS